jgi:hypothetical protein
MEKEYIDVTRSLRQKYKEKVKSYGVSKAMHEHLGMLIDVYKINFVDNFEYLTKYTGMTNKNYKKRLESMGAKISLGTITHIKNKKLIGFDLIHIAALANIFRLPVTLLLNYNLYDLKDFKPEDYGLYKGMFSPSTINTKPIDMVSIKPYYASVYKKITKKKALERSRNTLGVVNILEYV